MFILKNFFRIWFFSYYMTNLPQGRTFYREFNLPFGFEVSLDSESLIEQTIDSI